MLLDLYPQYAPQASSEEPALAAGGQTGAGRLALPHFFPPEWAALNDEEETATALLLALDPT
jgi:hypothetical protein